MDKILEAFSDALTDTLRILPFLLAVHLLIEWLEHSAASKLKIEKLLNGAYAPAAAGGLGLIPQCGFSVIATKLFSEKNIMLGTLIAVYIATSDEAIPILISDPNAWDKLLPLLLIKLIYAVSAGYLINFILRGKRAKGKSGKNPAAGKARAEDTIGCHGHVLEINENALLNGKEGGILEFIYHPVVHTLTIAGFILAVNTVFNLLFAWLGEDAVTGFLSAAKYAQPFIAGLVGLIPNCASSVVITQSYALGRITLGAAAAGLSVNAGLAYAVLFKENKNLLENLAIVGGLYLASSLLGFFLTLAGL